MGERVVIDKDKSIIIISNKEKSIWEDKTSSINALYKSYYFNNFTGYDVYYKNSDKKLFYPFERIQILNRIERININNHDVVINEHIYDVKYIDKYEYGFFKISYGRTNIITKHYTLSKGKYKNVLGYYKDLASYAGEITTDSEPLYFLAKNYSRISASADSIVYQYLSGINKKRKFDDFIIVPFDFNQSQHKAIKTALSNSISIIEGPPGTGKTQTILNLISNIITNNNNCAVISNNNTAVDNIYEKLDEEGISFIAAKLGSSEKVEQFFENYSNDALVEFLNFKIDEITFSDTHDINQHSAFMSKIFDSEIRKARLTNELNEVIVEQKNNHITDDKTRVINTKLQAKDYIYLIHRIEEVRKIKFFERWKLNRKYKIKIQKNELLSILDKAESLFYEKRIVEIETEIKVIDNLLNKYNKNVVIDKLKKISKKYLLNKIKKHYNNTGIKEFNKKEYKTNYTHFLKRYPVVLSTSQSLLNNAPQGFLFDYLIIDEASQGDLLSSVLAMSCAKNLIVVGDSRQLQQIDEERLFHQSKILADQYQIAKSYRYEDNSILKSVNDSVDNVPITLLREHYRCAPDIINFCNKMFYNNELIPMTTNTDKHIEIIKTVPGNHARKNPKGSGLYNQREIDELELLIKDKEKTSIGVITPFRYQANLISNNHPDDGLEADTIHKFQGRQKDEVYLSFVVNSLDKDPAQVENRLYDFITNEKLLNVAISRGKNKVTAIVSDKVYNSKNNIINDFIKYSEHLYGNSITKTSKTTSVFDYLYAEYDEILINKFKNKPHEHKTELLMCELIDDMLKDNNKIGYRMHVRLSTIVKNYESLSDEDKRYLTHPWTHVDFLFYNKVSKDRLFVLEVDGIQYHEQNDRQAHHDNIKDRALKLNEIPIYRFKTNESNEKIKLENILREYKY